jgi:hypothetical protein
MTRVYKHLMIAKYAETWSEINILLSEIKYTLAVQKVCLLYRVNSLDTFEHPVYYTFVCCLKAQKVLILKMCNFACGTVWV